MLISFNNSFHKLNFLGFVSYGIKKGFGFKSFLFFFRALLLLKLYLRRRKLNSFLLLFFVIRRLRPWIHFRISRFRRRRVTYVPKILSYRRSLGFAYFWFFKSARARDGYPTSLKLFLELIYSFRRKSSAIRLRKQAHILSFSYKKNLKHRYWNDKKNPLMRLVRIKYAQYRRKIIKKQKRAIWLFSFRRFLRNKRRLGLFAKGGLRRKGLHPNPVRFKKLVTLYKKKHPQFSKKSSGLIRLDRPVNDFRIFKTTGKNRSRKSYYPDKSNRSFFNNKFKPRFFKQLSLKDIQEELRSGKSPVLLRNQLKKRAVLDKLIQIRRIDASRRNKNSRVLKKK